MAQITLTDLGAWERYVPDAPPTSAPSSAMFARRISDGADWYAFAHNATVWPADSLKATATPSKLGLIVQAVVRDPSMIFPAGGQLFLIQGHDPADPAPWKSYEQQIVDLQAGTFTPQPPVAATTFKVDIWRRCSDDEAKTLDDLLASQPVRLQRLFNDATLLSHGDAFFAMLYAAVVQALGQARADVILAPSGQ